MIKKIIKNIDIKSVFLTNEGPIVRCHCKKKAILTHYRYKGMEVRVAICEDCKALLIRK